MGVTKIEQYGLGSKQPLCLYYVGGKGQGLEFRIYKSQCIIKSLYYY